MMLLEKGERRKQVRGEEQAAGRTLSRLIARSEEQRRVNHVTVTRVEEEVRFVL